MAWSGFSHTHTHTKLSSSNHPPDLPSILLVDRDCACARALARDPDSEEVVEILLLLLTKAVALQRSDEVTHQKCLLCYRFITTSTTTTTTTTTVMICLCQKNKL